MKLKKNFTYIYKFSIQNFITSRHLKVFIALGVYLLLFIISSCSSNAHLSKACKEEDVVCRSKIYVDLIMARKYEELKQSVKLDIVNTPNNDTMLHRLSDFLNNNNDSLVLTYKKIGNENAEVLDVEMNLENVSFVHDGPVIIFYFAQKSSNGIPLINWFIGGIPFRKEESSVFKMLDELEKSKKIKVDTTIEGK